MHTHKPCALITPTMTNALYYGDNLTVLRDHVPDESVDLVYLDPPFNSNASYNVLFREKSGEESPAQIKAFTDTWEWTLESQRTYENEIMLNPATPANVKEMIAAFRQFIGSNAMMAYLVMMTPRLVELRRVLKPTGSIYLHCDPTASHYLKVLMDAIFSKEHYINEIVWKRTTAHSDVVQGARHVGRIHDILLRYSKDKKPTWNTIYTPYDSDYVERIYRYVDADGRRYQTQPLHARKPGGDTLYEWNGKFPPPGRYWAFSKENMQRLEDEGRIVYSRNGVPRYKIYLDESSGRPLQDIWDDVTPVHLSPTERLGYATQKPLALLERIIQASSNEGDVVLDPFCGCGTAIAAAQKLNRSWIGIDITHLAVALMKNRLKTSFNILPGQDYKVGGEPVDTGSARALAEQDRFQFEFWAMSLLEAFPREQKKRGADQGVDGVVYFIDGPKRAMHKAIVQVKSGKVSSPLIRELKGTVERENASMGLFITLEPPSSPMTTEAISAGLYHSDLWQTDFPKIQIRTVEELLAGNSFQMPPHQPVYQPSRRIARSEGQQGRLA